MLYMGCITSYINPRCYVCNKEITKDYYSFVLNGITIDKFCSFICNVIGNNYEMMPYEPN